MNNTATINTFNNDNSNNANIKTQYKQTMTTTTNRFLKFEPTLKTGFRQKLQSNIP